MTLVFEVIKPLDTQGNLAERIFADDRYSQFQMALFVADMVNKLKNSNKGYTVLAPTNEAFAKLPSHLMDRILTDATTAESKLQRDRRIVCTITSVVKGINREMNVTNST